MSDDEIPEELRRLIEEQINRYNRQGQGDFDGLSAYRDGYDSAVAGQFEWDAFPVLRNDFRFDYPLGENHCYSIRMLSYFLEYLGLVDVTYPKDFRSLPTVVKTRLFDKFVKVRG